MITEAIVTTAIVYGYNRIRNLDIYNIKKQMKQVLQENRLDYYTILEIRKSSFGYIVIVSLNGKGLDKLIEAKCLFETKIGYLANIEQNANLKTATISIIKNKLTDNTKFIPIKTKSYELYFGKTYTLKNVIISMKELPHVLYSGINNSGKTYCVITALTNLIYFHNSREIEIFLAQISAKKDLRKFKDVGQCRGYADNLKEAYNMFSYLYHVMVKRIGMFNGIKDKYIDDIYEWNRNFPKRKMRIIYLAMDEFTAYMPDNLDNKEDAEIKQKCLDLLIKLIQQCRCTGIYILTSLQRPDKESLPPRLKAQFNCKISFKQPNTASSLVVVDCDKACYLKKREAIVCADEEYLIKTLYLDNKMITEFIKDSIDVTHKNYYNYKKIENVKSNNKVVELNKKSIKKEKSKINYKVKVKAR